jgi:aspartyl aminopeptidase
MYSFVDTASKLLVDAGFKKLSEKEQWNLTPKGKYFYTRNQSTLVAFVVGGKYVLPSAPLLFIKASFRKKEMDLI